ncbi:NAD(P)/FAD-dependent oxidoreductase [Pseudorhodoplanes sp.]|uniref:NAD(P)/FAD-dependent oxidoreductase n=1 Tax=Pseudorhodoplanes sp. TaxID=1934341 RepID=UPI002C81255C|nr:NAD(P)/FAD-dependent oxidoreductase [Pseudorhodoplanes sp.]HWV53244.1 NAD(P)/FAD-dependent oxidoreductase [Pseudorhodoplanes sp.]
MKRLLIIGAGFAGMHAALSAARLRDLQGVRPGELEIALISPEPFLVIRPRLYEANPETMKAPLSEVFAVCDIRYVQGSVETINTGSGSVVFTAPGGGSNILPYDRLVLAAGSTGFRPNIQGLAEYGFGVDMIEEAIRLDRHLHALPDRPASKARNTVVVAGGGFTGIETATEMPERLRTILGKDADIRVVIVERGEAIAKQIGDDPRPAIMKALGELGVETMLGIGVTSVDETGAVLSNGDRIDSATVIWTAGMRASVLTAQIAAPRDNLGRLQVDRDLRVQGVGHVFATGDTARAESDDLGNVATMSCQFAKRLGAFAGHNAAADLLGLPPKPYEQAAYVTCLDLGAAGAIFARGWNAKLKLTGTQAKSLKRDINTVWIYPPRADRAEIFAASEPELVLDLAAPAPQELAA